MSLELENSDIGSDRDNDNNDNEFYEFEDRDETDDTHDPESINASKTFTTETPEFTSYKQKLLGLPTYSDSRFTTYHIKGGENVKRFCKNIKTYGLNLPIKLEHCKNIETELLTEDSPLLGAEFSLVEYKEHETKDKSTLIELFDGHHRRIALRNIFKNNNNFNIDIRICIYNSDYPESPESKKLFRKFNILKPFDVDFNIMDIASLIINELNSKFNSSISNFTLIKDTQSTVQKPSIKQSIINECIQKRLELLKNRYNINANDIQIKSIIQNFERYNNKFSKKNLEWFTSNETFGIAKISKNMIEKSTKHKCFLGLVNLSSLIKHCIGEEYKL